MRAWVERAMERIVPYLQSLPEQPAAVWQGGVELARSLRDDAPENGAEFDDLLDLIFDQAVPHSLNTAGPGYLAYVPGGGLFHTAVASLIADAVNRYVGVWIAAPGMVQLESNVIRWFCGIVGYPQGSAGILTSGGSMANLTALVTARRNRLPDDFLNGTLYVSDQIHHSINKAAVLAGFPLERVRVIASDAEFRLDIDALRKAIQTDRAQGLQPFLIVASAGTINSGAVDPLPELADLANAENLWLHIDGAYGAFFALTERGRTRLKGLDRADSITLDPHKSLFLPYGTGSLLVRDAQHLRRAHSVSGDYMPAYQNDADLIDFCTLSAELSRDNRGLRCWLPLKMVGLNVFRQALDEKLDLARYAADQLREMPGVEIIAEPELSLLAFRLNCPGMSVAEADARNQNWLDAVNQRRHVYLTGTQLQGRFTLRICVLSFRTHLDRMEMAITDLRETATQAHQTTAGGAKPSR
jgi:aromatic-L-amino-acid/L-tryptophan decarboxylase